MWRRRVVERYRQPFHENLRCRSVRAYIDAHMAHDADEAQQHYRRAEETKAGGKLTAHAGQVAVGVRLVDMCGEEEQRSQDADGHIYGEEDAPAQSEVGDNVCRSPCGDIRCHERRYSLDKLSEA